MFRQGDGEITHPPAVDFYTFREALLRAGSENTRFKDVERVHDEASALDMSAERAFRDAAADVTRMTEIVTAQNKALAECLAMIEDSGDGTYPYLEREQTGPQEVADSLQRTDKTLDKWFELLVTRYERGGIGWEEAYSAMILGIRGVRRVPEYDKIGQPEVSTINLGGLNSFKMQRRQAETDAVGKQPFWSIRQCLVPRSFGGLLFSPNSSFLLTTMFCLSDL